jgi:hypothetical protein
MDWWLKTGAFKTKLSNENEIKQIKILNSSYRRQRLIALHHQMHFLVEEPTQKQTVSKMYRSSHCILHKYAYVVS